MQSEAINFWQYNVYTELHKTILLPRLCTNIWRNLCVQNCIRDTKKKMFYSRISEKRAANSNRNRLSAFPILVFIFC